jgi:hypothetical protein
MNAIYKTYDPDGNAIVFESVKEMGDFLGLDTSDRRKIFYPGVHITKGGDKIITYAD